MDQARAPKGADQAERARLLAILYTSLLPAVEARLFSLERLHAAGLMEPEEDEQA
jgi:hypothetical protein